MYLKLDKKTSIEIKNAKNFLAKFLGLMGKKNFHYGILLHNTNSIHTFFMKENIDIYGIDEKNNIIYINLNVPKNKVLFIRNKAKKTRVLELPVNSSKSFNIGDKLTFICK